VATTGGAIPEVSGPDGDTCFAVAPGDADALAVGIRRALVDPEAATAIGLRGRERVVRRWTWRQTAEKTVVHYRALLAEAAGNPAGNGGTAAAPTPPPPRS
jgi:glycosyltransferase involved in cell wall biosynthesis